MCSIHKKKAILFALPNLPSATGIAFTIPNVRKGFIYNGQLDAATTSVPSFANLLNTFRGNIEGSCLVDKKVLMEFFFEEMYLHGTIKESTFDRFDVPVDVDSKGNPVLKSNAISMENRHRAKILTSTEQIKERQMLVNSKRMKHYELKKRLYDAEQKDFSCNSECEIKFVEILKKAVPDMLEHIQTQQDIAFKAVHSYLTLDILKQYSSQVLNSDLKGFVKARTTRQMKWNKIVYLNVPGVKEQLMIRCVELRVVDCLEPICDLPTLPTLLPVD